MKTGYYATPRSERKFKVHIVKGRKPLCGYKPGRTMKFIKCAVGIFLPYITCSKCLNILQKNEDNYKIIR